MAKDVNLKNVLGFLEGNFKFYRDKFVKYPPWLQEQLQYRYEKCKEDCIANESCIKCGCPPVKKAFLRESCNPDRFPDLMDEVDWIKFKEDNNIE